jgi:hypothetical protein
MSSSLWNKRSSLLCGTADGFLLCGTTDGFLLCGITDGFLLCGTTEGFFLCGTTDGLLLCGTTDVLSPVEPYMYTVEQQMSSSLWNSRLVSPLWKTDVTPLWSNTCPFFLRNNRCPPLCGVTDVLFSLEKQMSSPLN